MKRILIALGLIAFADPAWAGQWAVSVEVDGRQWVPSVKVEDRCKAITHASMMCSYDTLLGDATRTKAVNPATGEEIIFHCVDLKAVEPLPPECR